MNWAVRAGLAYISWESKKTSDKSLWATPSGKDKNDPHSLDDWKHSIFEVDESDVKEHLRRIKCALFANAGCAGATMSDKVAHYKLGNYTLPARNYLTHSSDERIKSSKLGCNRRRLRMQRDGSFGDTAQVQRSNERSRIILVWLLVLLAPLLWQLNARRKAATRTTESNPRRRGVSSPPGLLPGYRRDKSVKPKPCSRLTPVVSPMGEPGI